MTVRDVVTYRYKLALYDVVYGARLLRLVLAPFDNIGGVDFIDIRCRVVGHETVPFHAHVNITGVVLLEVRAGVLW